MDELEESDKDILIQFVVEREQKRLKRNEITRRYRANRSLEQREKVASKAKGKRAMFKALVFLHYGNKCACCGENIHEFLSIDHMDNDGAEHRKELGGSWKLYEWIVDNDYPDNLQLLCRNCNWGKHINNGICPHKA